MRATVDFETKSESDLPKCGAWAYSEHPSTDIICVGYAIDDGEVQTWWPGKGDESIHDLFSHIEKSWCVEAHNVAFERSLINGGTPWPWLNTTPSLLPWPSSRMS